MSIIKLLSGMKNPARVAASLAAGIALATAGFGSASAQNYPTKDINWVIPFSAGSGADTFARTLIEATQKHLGVNIVPLNRPGGGTAVGVAFALSQPADGYTVFSQSTTLPESIAYGNVPFAAEDIQAVARINADYKTLAVHKDSRFTSYQDFAEYAKANPGGVKIGGVGARSWSSAFVQKLQDGGDLSLTYVPYDGGSNVVSAVLGENLDAMVVTSSNINALIDSGDIRLLAVSTGERAPDRPDVPTFKELGFDQIDNDLLWRGVFVKAGTPVEVLNALEAAFEKAVQEDVWKAYMERERQQSVFLGHEAFQKVFVDLVEETKAAQ